MCLEEQNLIVRVEICHENYFPVLLPFIVPGTVTTVNVNVLNTTTVQIKWSPVPQEQANGIITHYIVFVSLYEGRELYNRNISVSSDLQVIVNRLSEFFSLNYISLDYISLDFIKLEKFLMKQL